MKPLMVMVVLAVGTVGCTSEATKIAMQQYQKSESFKQLAFNNSTRIANEQMLLNLEQYIKLHSTEPDKITEAVKVTWTARNQLEVSREQYLYARALTMLTVGQYIYNQQGILNAWIEGKADLLHTASESADAANKAAGTNSVKDLVPPLQGVPPIADLLKNLKR